jgi:hypothetical protein
LATELKGDDMSESRPKAIATPLISNDRVIVTEWRFASGAETGWHRHGYDYVVLPQTNGKLRRHHHRLGGFVDRVIEQSTQLLLAGKQVRVIEELYQGALGS